MITVNSYFCGAVRTKLLLCVTIARKVKKMMDIYQDALDHFGEKAQAQQTIVVRKNRTTGLFMLRRQRLMQVDLFNKPQLNADPDASPLAYHYATNDEDMKDIMALRDAGLTPLVWAVHFVVFEKCRTVAQFCTFQPNDDWGANYVELLEERQRLLASNIGSA